MFLGQDAGEEESVERSNRRGLGCFECAEGVREHAGLAEEDNDVGTGNGGGGGGEEAVEEGSDGGGGASGREGGDGEGEGSSIGVGVGRECSGAADGENAGRVLLGAEK